MATIVYRNAYFWANGVDYSGDVKELTLNYKAEMLDATAMGADTRTKKGGLKVWDMGMKFIQDFTTGHTGSTFWQLVGTTTCLEMRPQNACTSVANPSFSGIGILEAYPPMTGAVGVLLESQATFQSASTLSRASSS